MKALNIERVQQLDAECGAKIRDSLHCIRRENVLHEDNRELFLAMAERFGVGIEELSSYVWLQMYIREMRESFDDLPSPRVVAQQFGIPLAELDAYICGRDDVTTAEEHRDFLEDLQEDAGLQGD